MKTARKIRHFKVALLISSLFLTACIGIKGYDRLDEAGKDVVDGAFQSLEENQETLDSLVLRLSNSLVNSLLDGTSKIDIAAYEDDMTKVLKGTIQNGLLNEQNKQSLKQLISDLMSQIDAQLVNTVEKLPKQALNDDFMNRLGEVRTTLLGEETQKQVTALVRSALVPTKNLRLDLKNDVKELIDYANDKGTGITDGLGSLAKTLIGGAILIILALGFAIYLIRKKLKQYKTGLLKTAEKIDRLDRTNYDNTILKPEDFESSPETYKTINNLIQENEGLFENKRRYKNYQRSALEHLATYINENLSDKEIEELIEVAGKNSGEDIAKFISDEISRKK